MREWKKYLNERYLIYSVIFLMGVLAVFLEQKKSQKVQSVPIDKVAEDQVPESEKKQEHRRGQETEEKAAAEEEEDVKPRIALTFDDGPHFIYTEKLLDGLKERGIHATFFLIGKSISGNEALVKRMSEEGHLIGNHTYDHVKITDLTPEAACDEVTKTSDLVQQITGNPTEYIRPPFGEWDKDLECGLQLFPVMWDVDPLDWTTSNVDSVVNKVVTKAKDGAIILLHDIFDSSVEAALQIIDQLTAKGYEFVTVDELILE